MRIIKILPLLVLTGLQFGCAEQYVYQSPAPVYRSRPVTELPPIPSTKTYQYPETPDPQPAPEAPKQLTYIPPTAPVAPNPPVAEPETPPVAPPESVFSDSLSAVASPPPEAPPPAPEIPSLPPLALDSFSPAILALANEAEQNTQAGQYESAGVKIERALRIEPRNAILTYKLACIRLKQEQPRLAEDLAKKAALLAGNNTDLKKRTWLLIAESKRLQHDYEAASAAEQKAAQY